MFFREKRSAPHPEEPLTTWDRRLMACHEAGHAVCSRYLPQREPLVKITIDPSDETFGMITTTPRPHHNETKASLLSAAATLLAGRLAEELLLGEVTTSCIHDLAAARSIARKMVLELGMGDELGMLAPATTEHCGERLKNAVDADVQRLLNAASALAAGILRERLETVKALAETLLETGTMERAAIEEFFKSRGAP